MLPTFTLFLFYNYAKGWIILIALPLLIWAGLLKERKIISSQFLLLIILIQSSVFIFFPKQPNKIDEWFVPKYRNESIPVSWYNRTFSVYSMTYSKINEQDKILSGFIEKIDSLIPGSGKEASLFIDPSYYTYARPLQYIYPNRQFITLDFDREDGYI